MASQMASLMRAGWTRSSLWRTRAMRLPNGEKGGGGEGRVCVWEICRSLL